MRLLRTTFRSSDFVSRLVLLSVLLFSAAVQPVKGETAAQLTKRMYNNYDLSEVMFPLRQALRENPRDPELHYLMGEMYMTRCGSKLRGQRELELCLSLDPQFAHAQECKQMIQSWKKEQEQKGKKHSWANLDYWFDDYYRTHKYDSTDEDAAPDWTKKHDNDREWKVDVHFIGGNYNLPGGGTAASYTADWTCDFLTAFREAWEKKAKAAQLEGTADLYCRIDPTGVAHPIIAQLRGGSRFKGILLDTFKSLDRSNIFVRAGKSNICFKARIASKYALNNCGTWCAFGTASAVAVPVRVKLMGVFDTKQSESLSGTMVTREAVPPMQGEPPVALPLVAGGVKTEHNALLTEARLDINKGDFQRAYKQLWPLVEINDADACFLMAEALNSRNNIHPEPRVAELFYEKAYKLGNSDAFMKLFDAVEFGNSAFRMSMNEAVSLLQKHAAAGSSLCQSTLGRLLEFGDSVTPNKAMAIHYYKLAAAAGIDDAAAGLERLRVKEIPQRPQTRLGKGTPRNAR